MQKTYQVEIQWRAFPLHPDTPEDGLWLSELFARYPTPVDVTQAMERLKQTAERLGLPFGERQKTYNSRLAQELGQWAESQNKGNAFHAAAFRAYFADGQNLAKIPVLLNLATSIGLPSDEAARVLNQRLFKKAVDADWSRSHQLGITAVPTLYANHKFLIGAHPYTAMAKFIEANGGYRR